MAVADRLESRARANPRVATAILSLAGYTLVVGTFGGVFPYPDLARGIVILLGDVIAVVNLATLLAIAVGISAIRKGAVARHRTAMLTAFALILLFLGLYLLKIGGGFEKHILVDGPVLIAYRAMLAVHIVLSAVAVPVVIHAVVLGLTHTPAELRDSPHPRVGRVAVAAWTISLVLGLVTYVMLNHVYTWEVRGAALLVIASPGLPLVRSTRRS